MVSPPTVSAGHRLLWVVGLLGCCLAALLAGCDIGAASSDVTLEDVFGDVQIRQPNGELSEARSGIGVAEGAQVETGEAALARLAFSSGPFIRLSSNTRLVREAAQAGEDARLRLETGRLRLNLFRWRFGIVTPLGLFQLQGFGDVNYQTGASADLSDDVVDFRCFSGPCRFQFGGTALNFDNMEGVAISNSGQTVTRVVLTDLDLRQFLADNPGSAVLLASLTAAPTRTSSPTPITPSPTASNTPLPPTATPPVTSTPTRTRTRPPVTIQRTPSLLTATPTETSLTPTATETATPTASGDGGGGGNDNPPTPTPTPIRPTPTQPPTNTAPPPTDTPVPPTDTPPPPPPPTKTPTP
jgi:hypothetical protein